MVRPLSAACLAVLLVPVTAALGAPPEPVAHRIYLIGALRLSHPHFRLDSDDPVAIIEIQNRSGSADRLVGATVDGATETVLAGGDGVGSLTIPARATVMMRRDGAHLVTHGWTNPGSPDGRLGATLRFARAGDIRVSLRRETNDEPEPETPVGPTERVIDLAR